MLKAIYNRLKQSLVKFKGPFSKAGGILDYTEVHKFIYGIVLGLVIFRVSTLRNKILDGQSFGDWEASEGHYSDPVMIYVFILKYWAIYRVFGAREVLLNAILGA